MDEARTPEPAPPWYAEGLSFACTGSGRCCRNHGEHAYVYLEDVELSALAAHVGLEVPEFFERYCAEDEGWTTLRMDEPQCPFLDGSGRCGVYEARPVQCRTWPFWTENLKSANGWKRAAEICPGIGQGRLYTAEEASRISEANEAWYMGEHEGPLPTTDDGPPAD